MSFQFISALSALVFSYCVATAQEPNWEDVDADLGKQIEHAEYLSSNYAEGVKPLYALWYQDGSFGVYDAFEQKPWKMGISKIILPGGGFMPSSFTLQDNKGNFHIYAERLDLSDYGWDEIATLKKGQIDSINMVDFGRYIAFKGEDVKFYSFEDGQFSVKKTIMGAKVVSNPSFNNLLFLKHLIGPNKGRIGVYNPEDGSVVSAINFDSLVIAPYSSNSNGLVIVDSEPMVYNLLKDSLVDRGFYAYEEVIMYGFPVVFHDDHVSMGEDDWKSFKTGKILHFEFDVIEDFVDLVIINDQSEKIVIDCWDLIEKSRNPIDLDTFSYTSLEVAIGSELPVKVLNLAYEMIDQWPQQLMTLKDLEVLSLSSNRLEEIPEQICDLQNLRELNLSYNDLNGLPSCILKMESLEVIDLSGLPFAPDLASLLELPNLKELSIDGYYYDPVELDSYKEQYPHITLRSE